jgi:hypothetical protein
VWFEVSEEMIDLYLAESCAAGWYEVGVKAVGWWL